MMEKEKLLLQGDGRPCMTDDDKTVPAKCPVCGSDMEIYILCGLRYICREGHIYGRVKIIQYKME